MWLLPALLLATLAAYQPAWHGGVLWDDPAHLTRPDLQSVDGLRRIWTEVGATQQYYPVTYSAFWAMHRLWGDNTLGYHLVNIVTHASSAFVLAWLLTRLSVPGAAFAAFIFALHPVHAESVAWMTELKNTLSGLLYLLAFASALAFDRDRTAGRYTMAFGLFVLAVLSKTTAVTLPAAVLVVLWWKRGRLDVRRDLLPAVPMLVVGVSLGLFVAWVERSHAGAEGSAFQFSPVERLLIAGRALWFYAGKIVWPSPLVFIYPRWHVDQAVWWQYVFPLAAAATVAGLWWYRDKSRGPLAAVLFFAGTLFPALGFVNVFAFQYSFVADHFQYLASMGLIALIAGLAAHLSARLRVPQGAAIGAAAAVVLVLGVLTWRESFEYRDAETLYTKTLEANPECWMAHNNLGEVVFRESAARLPEAVGHLEAAIRIKPDYAMAHDNLGVALEQLGRRDDAVREFELARRLEPRFFSPRLHAGNAFREARRLDEAVAAYEEAIALRPRDLESRANLAGVLIEQGQPEAAAKQLRVAIAIDPGSQAIRANLATALTATGNAHLKGGQPAAALGPYEEALRVMPDGVEAHNNIAVALLQLNRPEDALPHLRECVRLLPGSPVMRANLESVEKSIAERRGAAAGRS